MSSSVITISAKVLPGIRQQFCVHEAHVRFDFAVPFQPGEGFNMLVPTRPFQTDLLHENSRGMAQNRIA